jgi:myo-inositol-1(or 4)-monophosphatase
MEPTLKEIELLAREAGKILRAGFGQKHQVTAKSAIDLVTEIDKQSEEFILKEIRSKFPNDTVVAEESGTSLGNESQGAWYIDPLDGTSNYVHGLPIFSVSIAYARAGAMQLAVVYDPIADECYTAERGQGAFLNGKRIHVAEQQDLLRVMLVTGFPYEVHKTRLNLVQFEKFVTSVQAVRRLGSAALDLCYVAAGRLDGYWEMEIFPWDIAAGKLIVEEAGGVVTHADGNSIQLTIPLTIVAANPGLNRQMVKIIANSIDAI